MAQRRWFVVGIFLSAISATSVRGNEPAQRSDAPASEANVSPYSDVLAGHSYHGEVFNEGPRQRAYLMSGTGRVHFPVSTPNEAAQKFIDQGVGQLHGFWYFEAERSFRQAATLDPNCAMAYWGAALANLKNDQRALGFIAEAVKRKDRVTDRERRYIEAADAYLQAGKAKNKQRSEAYTKALEDILAAYPDDLEAKALLALQLYQNRSAGVPITSYFAVNALIQEVLDIEPLHPVHHFRIHLWDARRPEEALASAALCGQGSPSIAHMWHMPGHIYSRLKRYHDAVWQQEASARVDHAHMIRDRVMPDQIHNFAHNNEWLIRNLTHIGRWRDAIDLAKNMIELPRHPKYNTLAKRGSAYYGRLRLFEVLSKYEQWDEMIALCDSRHLEPTDNETEQVKRLRHLGEAYYRKGDVVKGDGALAELVARLEQPKSTEATASAPEDTSKDEADDNAKAPDENTDKYSAEKADTSRGSTGKLRSLEQQVSALSGFQAVAGGDYEKGLPLLERAGDVDPLVLAQVRFLAGKHEEAIHAVRSQVKSRRNEVLPLAHLVDLLWRDDQKDEAGRAFQQLRDLSSAIDIDSPVFARLGPIASQLGLPEDWRVNRTPPGDVGERPELDSLGPFRWHPSPAPLWSLQDIEGNSVSFKQFHGQPLLLIFYLGYGCLHCAEQLQAFGPATPDFERAGLRVVAISSDDKAGLKASVENYDGGRVPIPLLANPKLDVFRAYRAYDDFEDQPLHGTFLIDGGGLVRWQDISFEPFMDHQFVLNEAGRLLSQTK